jgi:hypothetical protein
VHFSRLLIKSARQSCADFYGKSKSFPERGFTAISP